MSQPSGLYSATSMLIADQITQGANAMRNLNPWNGFAIPEGSCAVNPMCFASEKLIDNDTLSSMASGSNAPQYINRNIEFEEHVNWQLSPRCVSLDEFQVNLKHVIHS